MVQRCNTDPSHALRAAFGACLLGCSDGADIREAPQSGILWSHTGYHFDRMAFYIVADTSRLSCGEAMVKPKHMPISEH